MFHHVKVFDSRGQLKKIITPKQLKVRDDRLFSEGSGTVSMNGGTGVRNEPVKFPCARPGCNNIGESWSTRGGKYCSPSCGNTHRKALKRAADKKTNINNGDAP